MRYLLPAVFGLALLSGCGAGYDEDAHRADVAEVLGVEEVEDSRWETVRDLAEEHCASSEEELALATGVALDNADADEHIALRRVNVEHVCPEREGEQEAVLEELGYAG
ncbi:hypothetical protein [Nocardiopsis trehalosi]|uniref:hypothetical protein n=1 Tax=Nocardiopsis trehalosi TaxID=109329 RepID=UPI000834A440|nr:hypothetical protein [Nocardiopsis trehalosi]